MKPTIVFCLVASLMLGAGSALADPPVVENVKAISHTGVWTISVTLRHPDTGWDHYADGWEVLLADATRLGFRELLHPHVNEQPFTRSLSGVVIPAGTDQILIRARDNLEGWAEATYRVELAD